MLDLDVLRQVAEEFIPFNKWLGMKVEHLERGQVIMSIPWRPEIVGDPTVPALHGGVIGAVADATGGIAVWSMLDNAASRLSTVDMRVDYLRPGKQEKLLASSNVVRLGARLGWADVRLYHPGRENELIATARAVYTIKIPKHARTDG
ncbi:MAG TPA: hotdog fold thioesterase [Polyangium sp.]|nr:hotdog fold thioesterase [Polyangium sp.]